MNRYFEIGGNSLLLNLFTRSDAHKSFQAQRSQELRGVGRPFNVEKLRLLEKLEIAIQGDDYADKEHQDTNHEALQYARAAAAVLGWAFDNGNHGLGVDSAEASYWYNRMKSAHKKDTVQIYKDRAELHLQKYPYSEPALLFEEM